MLWYKRGMRDWTPKEIRQLRQAMGLSQKKFAEILGVTEQFIYYLERGVRIATKPFRLLLDCIAEKHLKENEKGKESEKKHGKGTIQKR